MERDRTERRPFDLEEAIAAYRAQLERSDGLRPIDVDELESHLRDDLDALAEAGIEGRDAFERAMSKLGAPRALGDEFARGNPASAWRLPGFFFVAGALLSVMSDVVRAVAEPLVRLASNALDVGARTGSIAHAVAVGAPLTAALVLGPHLARRLLPAARPTPRSLRAATDGHRRPRVVASLRRIALVVGVGLIVMVVCSTPLTTAIPTSVQPLDPGRLRLVDTWASVGASARRLLWHLEPVVLATGVVVARWRGVRGRAGGHAPFWVLAGLLGHVFWWDLHASLLNVAMLASGLSHATPLVAVRTVYAAGLALNASLLGTLYAVRNRLPPPRVILDTAWTDAVALVVGGICLVLTFRYSLLPKNDLGRDVVDAIWGAWGRMGTVIDLVVPALLAALLFRFRDLVVTDRRVTAIE